MDLINRGSEWRKWDLHIHTASSYDAYRSNDSDELLVQKLNEHEIKVVAITDHFVIDKERINRLKELAPDIVIFPGVELRTDKGDSNIHVILIFSDKINLQHLCTDFDSFKRNKAKFLDSNDKIYWDYKDIVEFATSKDGIISIHAGSKTNGLDDRISNALQCSQAIKEEYARTVNIFEIGNQKDIDGYKKHVFPIIGLKPLIFGSDNHDPRKYNGDRVVCIKSDTTFEGLKQIIYEPEERIRYGKNHPVTNQNYMLIDYVEYNGGEKIYFNSGLNVIIGGRSTGKSTLLNSIAKYQGNKNFISDNHYTFKKDEFNKDDEFKVVWLDGKSDKDRSIEFIPQEFMINISKDTGMFNNLLSEIITKRGMNSAEQSYKEKVEKIKADITREITEYFSLKEEKEKLIKPEGDKIGAENLIKELTEKIGKIRIENQFSEDDNKNYQFAIKKLDDLLSEIKLLEKELENLNSLKTIDFSINADLGELSEETKKSVNKQLDFIKENSTSLWIKFIDKIISNIQNDISQKNNEIASIKKSSILVKGKELETKNEELGQLEKQLGENRKVIENIEEYSKKCSQIEKNLKDKLDSISDNFCKFHEDICTFSNEFNIEEKDLKITVRVSPFMLEDKVDYLNSRNNKNNDFIKEFNAKIQNFDENDYKKFAKNLIVEQNLTFNKNKNMDDLLKDIFMTNWYRYDYIVTYQNDEFKDMSQGKKSFVILKLLLEFSDDKKPVLIDQPEDSLDNRAIFHELRKYLIDTKKNRQIILVTHNPNVVIGADAENVIVANQHSNLEENRNKKKFQYINGSIENTSTRDETCKYVLESQGIREHIFDVLEGGKEAFEKREKKYNY